jgi:hypothetical protein
MHTTAILHVHPTVANPHPIFEIRLLGRAYGCPFIASKPKLQQSSGIVPHGPNERGRAA